MISRRQRFVISAILLFVAVLVGLDLFNDSRQGVMGWHLLSEGFTGLAARVPAAQGIAK